MLCLAQLSLSFLPCCQMSSRILPSVVAGHRVVRRAECRACASESYHRCNTGEHSMACCKYVAKNCHLQNRTEVMGKRPGQTIIVYNCVQRRTIEPGDSSHNIFAQGRGDKAKPCLANAAWDEVCAERYLGDVTGMSAPPGLSRALSLVI